MMTSIVNSIYAAGTRGQPDPVVGMGATILGGSDRHAATIVEVLKIGKCLAVVVQRDKARRTDDLGMSDSQDYEYTADPEAPRRTYRFRSGRWEAVYQDRNTMRWRSDRYDSLAIGFRREFYNFSL